MKPDRATTATLSAVIEIDVKKLQPVIEDFMARQRALVGAMSEFRDWLLLDE